MADPVQHENCRCIVVPVSVREVELVEFDPGHWCPSCALPSAVKVTIATTISVNGIEGPTRVGSGVRCMDGHDWLPTAATE